MRKTNFSFVALCLLFLANLIQAILHGFDWLFAVAAALTAAAIVLNVLNVLEVKRNGRK